MIILITGASHTGKTLLAQKLLEKYKINFLSVDHLKMGLIRSGNTDLTVYDDDKLTEYLWPITAEIIKTAIENGQDLIAEGCYIPVDFKKYFSEKYLPHIKFICLVFSENYIEHHFDDIVKYSCAAEKRKDDFLNIEEVKRENRRFFENCKKEGCEYILSDKKYCLRFDPLKVWESERLKYYRITDGDFNQLSDMLKDPYVMRFWEHVFSDGEVREWIEKRKKGYRENGYDYFLAKDKVTKKVIGQIGLLEENINGESAACLGYMLKKQYMHMGYAVEGAAAMLEYAFKELNKSEVRATIRPENLPSVKVAAGVKMKKQSGMIKFYTGKEMPHDVYAITREEWLRRGKVKE